MSGEHQHCPFCGDDMCDGRCYDALLDRLANAGIDLIAKDRRISALEADNAKLRSVVDKLPKTADGVPMVPLAGPVPEIWHLRWKFGEQFAEQLTQNEWDQAIRDGVDVWSDGFSTRAAAEAAANGGGDE